MLKKLEKREIIYIQFFFSNIKRHLASFHEGRRDFPCDRCDKMFSDKSSVAKHKKTGKEFFLHDAEKLELNLLFPLTHVKKYVQYTVLA